MCRSIFRKQRRGVTTVEFAATAPLMIFVLIGTMVGGLGVFRYQQVAALARDGSRWASVHGAQYEEDTGNPAATPDDVLNTAILPRATALDPERLTCDVTWDDSNMPLQVIDDVQTPTGNTVTVTVTYEWLPELLLLGPIELTSSSTAQMCY